MKSAVASESCGCLEILEDRLLSHSYTHIHSLSPLSFSWSMASLIFPFSYSPLFYYTPRLPTHSHTTNTFLSSIVARAFSSFPFSLAPPLYFSSYYFCACCDIYFLPPYYPTRQRRNPPPLHFSFSLSLSFTAAAAATPYFSVETLLHSHENHQFPFVRASVWFYYSLHLIFISLTFLTYKTDNIPVKKKYKLVFFFFNN